MSTKNFNLKILIAKLYCLKYNRDVALKELLKYQNNKKYNFIE